MKKIGNYLFMVAAADEIIDQSEIKAIKSIFHDFGLDEKLLNIILDEFRAKVKVEESTKIKNGEKVNKTGSNIPEKKDDSNKMTIQIDQNKLKTVLEDTENVKNILANVFVQEESEVVENELEIDSKYNLPNEINNFMKQITRKEKWTRDELRKLAIDNKIMLDSAIEQINYWCEEEKGDYLIFEEQGNYLIQKEILLEL